LRQDGVKQWYLLVIVKEGPQLALSILAVGTGGRHFLRGVRNLLTLCIYILILVLKGRMKHEKQKECHICFEEVLKLSACAICTQASCLECTEKWREQQLKEELIPTCAYCRHEEANELPPTPPEESCLAHRYARQCLLLLLIALIVSLPLSELYFSRQNVFYAYLFVVLMLLLIFCYHSQTMQQTLEAEDYDDYAV
jgi:hypothetical protein